MNRFSGIAVFFCCLISFCTNFLFADDSSSPGAVKKIPLFDDCRFQRGFLLSYPDSSKGRETEAVLRGEKENVQPAWRLCQWATKYDLAKAICENLHGDFVYQNEAKKVVFGNTASENRDLILEIHGLAEYGDRPRRTGEAWPHLLIEQDARGTYPLSELAGLSLKIQLRLLFFQDGMKGGFDPGLHAAQFQLFFIIKNIQPQSKDFGNFFWFGVPFFDNRHDIPPAYRARDVGKNDATGKFIDTLDGTKINSIPMQQGGWITVDCDLLPFIQEGLKQAVARGYLQDSDPKNYAPVNMNLGWEIPGTYDASIQVKDFNVDCVIK